MDPSAFLAPHSMLLDIENMTSERWRSLITEKLTTQKDTFINSFKKKVLGDINTCVESAEPNEELKSLHKSLVDKIVKNKFEFEYQTFADGIVGTTFEYVCQLIIKNSIDNINRTQNALNTFSSTSNMNNVALQSCNVDINLQGSYLTQTQCSSELKNNTNNLGKVIQPNLFMAQNGINSSMTLGTENDESITINKLNASSVQNSDSSKKNNGSSLPLEVNTSSKINIESNYKYVHTVHSSVTVEEIADSDQDLMDFAISINEEVPSFKFTDGSEDVNITYSDNESAVNEIQINNLLSKQKGDCCWDNKPIEMHVDMAKTSNGLKKIVNDNNCNLENLEQTKLDVAESEVLEPEVLEPKVIESEVLETKVIEPAVLEPKVLDPKLQDFNVQTNKKKHSKKSKKKSSSKEKHDISKKRSHTFLDETKNKRIKYKNHILKEKISNKTKKSEDKHRKLKNDNSENKFSSNSCKLSEIKNDQNISLSTHSLSVLCSNNESGSELLITKTSKCSEIPLVSEVIHYGNKKDGSQILSHSGNSCIVSARSSIEKDVDYLTNKSAASSSSLKTSLDYKKIYEMDRKSLFSPDIILKSPAKISTTDLSTRSQKDGKMTEKNSKTLQSTTEIHCSTKKKKKAIKDQNISNKNSILGAKSKPSSSSFNNKSSSSKVLNDHSKFKRLKVEHDSDDENKVTKLDSDIITKEEKNKDLVISVDILENNKSNDHNYMDQITIKHNLKPVCVNLCQIDTYYSTKEGFLYSCNICLTNIHRNNNQQTDFDKSKS